MSIALAAVALPAWAQHVPVPLMSAEEMQGLMPNGAKMETRVDGDFNGDGEIDTAFVWRSEEGVDEARGLMVGVAYRNEFDLGHDPAGELSLDPFPLGGSASLSVRKGVLIVEDLTGGTTATHSIRRYRYDAKQRKMRLIGIDAERYSRTNSHGTIKISWNLLDGTHIVERGEPNTGPGDEAIIYAKPERTVRKALPVWMEGATDPDALIDMEVPPAGEDRD